MGVASAGPENATPIDRVNTIAAMAHFFVISFFPLSLISEVDIAQSADCWKPVLQDACQKALRERNKKS